MTLEKKIDVSEGLDDFIKLNDSELTAEKLDNYFKKWEKEKGREYVEELRNHISLYSRSRRVIRERRKYDDWVANLPAR